jgi:hypothetical protein
MSDSLDDMLNAEQKELDFNVYTDYVYIDGLTTTIKNVEEFIERLRDEIDTASNTVQFISFNEDDLKSDAFKLTNLLSEVGAKLTRGYSILRVVKAYRTKFIRQWEELSNKELSDGMTGKPTKDIRAATLANRYKMIYTSIQLLNSFIDNEIMEYINEMTVAKEILSRQASSLEIELKLASM